MKPRYAQEDHAASNHPVVGPGVDGGFAPAAPVDADGSQALLDDGTWGAVSGGSTSGPHKVARVWNGYSNTFRGLTGTSGSTARAGATSGSLLQRSNAGQIQPVGVSNPKYWLSEVNLGLGSSFTDAYDWKVRHLFGGEWLTAASPLYTLGWFGMRNDDTFFPLGVGGTGNFSDKGAAYTAFNGFGFAYDCMPRGADDFADSGTASTPILGDGSYYTDVSITYGTGVDGAQVDLTYTRPLSNSGSRAEIAYADGSTDVYSTGGQGVYGPWTVTIPSSSSTAAARGGVVGVRMAVKTNAFAASNPWAETGYTWSASNFPTLTLVADWVEVVFHGDFPKFAPRWYTTESPDGVTTPTTEDTGMLVLDNHLYEVTFEQSGGGPIVGTLTDLETDDSFSTEFTSRGSDGLGYQWHGFRGTSVSSDARVAHVSWRGVVANGLA